MSADIPSQSNNAAGFANNFSEQGKQPVLTRQATGAKMAAQGPGPPIS
jgi:hypothetical protein